MAEAAARGAGAMFLEVAVGNAAGPGALRGAGFAEVGRRPRYYATARTRWCCARSWRRRPRMRRVDPRRRKALPEPSARDQPTSRRRNGPGFTPCGSAGGSFRPPPLRRRARVALLGRAAGNVGAGLLAAQPDQQNLPRRQPIERQSGAHECHRADIGGDVQLLIGKRRGARLVQHCQLLRNRHVHCETAGNSLYMAQVVRSKGPRWPITRQTPMFWG